MLVIIQECFRYTIFTTFVICTHLNYFLYSVLLFFYFKVACRVQIWKKYIFCQNSDNFCCSFIKNDIMFMYLLYIYKKSIILSLFRIDTLNFTMYILANSACPLKTYVRLHNLISMNIFFTIKDHSLSLVFFFIIVKRKPKNRFQKAFKTQTYLNPFPVKIFVSIRNYGYPL